MALSGFWHWLRADRKRAANGLGTAQAKKKGRRRYYRPGIELLEPRLLLDTGINQLFVKQAYGDLLQRDIEPAGLTYWSGLLDRGSSRTDVSLLIENGVEAHTKMVKELYGSLLGRMADPSGLTTFVAILSAGGTVEETKELIAASSEYRLRSGSTDAGYIASLYRDVLGRGTDPLGASSWEALLATGVSRVGVATGIVHSPEAGRRLVQGLYQQSLHRAADPAGLASFATAYGGGWHEEQILASLEQYVT